MALARLEARGWALRLARRVRADLIVSAHPRGFAFERCISILNPHRTFSCERLKSDGPQADDRDGSAHLDGEPWTICSMGGLVMRGRSLFASFLSLGLLMTAAVSPATAVEIPLDLTEAQIPLSEIEPRPSAAGVIFDKGFTRRRTLTAITLPIPSSLTATGTSEHSARISAMGYRPHING